MLKILMAAVMIFALIPSTISYSKERSEFALKIDTAGDLEKSCTYKGDPYWEAQQENQCQSYLKGSIDMLRLYYSLNDQKCLPSKFTLSKLRDDFLWLIGQQAGVREIRASGAITMVMKLKHGCNFESEKLFNHGNMPTADK